MAKLLPNWPYENQLNSPTTDGLPDNNAGDNCGETSVSMILKWSQGVYIAPDTIKDQVLGPNAVNVYSYVYQLSDYLNQHGVATQWREDDNPSDALAALMRNVDQGHPSIVLLYADRANQTGGHFCAFIGYTDQGDAILANPWGGFEETLNPDQWRQAYNHYIILTQASEKAAPAPHPAGPRFLVLRSMMARTKPSLVAVKWPIQMVNKGAVLDGTGQQTPHWVEVTAGGQKVWLWLANLKPVP